ncbi:hypothetical protein MTO96_044114 [Rhipicephalus appendiculatus]
MVGRVLLLGTSFANRVANTKPGTPTDTTTPQVTSRPAEPSETGRIHDELEMGPPCRDGCNIIGKMIPKSNGT